MELRHFRYAVAVADTLHFGRAAERLHISQPPLSQQIRQLEQELGVTLFHRTKRQVRLTEAGSVFVREARLILAQADQAVRLAMRASHGDVGQLTIGVAGPADAPIIIDILRLFGKSHPDVRITLRTMNTAQQADALRDGRIHVGFLAGPLEDPALAIEPVLHQPFVIALPHTHPFASRARVPLRALASESHIVFAPDLGPRVVEAIAGACRRAGFQLDVVHEVDDWHTACALVAAGLGVCFVPAGVQERRSRSIVLRPLTPALTHVESDLSVAYPREPQCELVQPFVAVVKRAAARRLRMAASGDAQDDGRPSPPVTAPAPAGPGDAGTPGADPLAVGSRIRPAVR